MACVSGFSSISFEVLMRKTRSALGSSKQAATQLCCEIKLLVSATQSHKRSIPAESPSSALTLPLPTHADANYELANYDPDEDDYDVRTAPIIPASGSDDLLLKQIDALQGRIRKGGAPCVLEHYQNVIQDMKLLLKEPRGSRHKLLPPLPRCSGHNRTFSSSSRGSAVSTRCSDAEDSPPVSMSGTGPSACNVHER
eukprot:TRINITY_DN10539_c0_g1_i1.p1 TRINITY_DN10539_c0_g1~~TRINITY_DN10539_c0_g1_i1.p1  ORF type:complete len:217 (+),score=21.63 TRINITY_DN10539_c0_g1_i1:62-652(+)